MRDPNNRTTNKADIMTSALFSAFDDVKIMAKRKEKSFIEEVNEEDEDLERLGAESYKRERRGSNDSVASFMTDIQRMDAQVSKYLIIAGKVCPEEEKS